MSAASADEPTPGGPQGRIYRIRLEGQLSADWSEWFGLAVTPLEDGDTLLVGPLPDQAALHGVFARIRDLGLSLVCVSRSTGGASPPAVGGTPR
jgi:hypothetical protein